jgi:hypothetical protein
MTYRSAGAQVLEQPPFSHRDKIKKKVSELRQQFLSMPILLQDQQIETETINGWISRTEAG